MLIRTQKDLQAHIGKLRKKDETDKALSQRLGIHVNTLTKLKHGTNMFEASPSMRVLGLRIVYEVPK